MMLFLSVCFALAALGFSTCTPGSSMKLVVLMKKISKNMMMSMSGIRFSSMDSSGSASWRRNLMTWLTALRGDAHILRPAHPSFINDADHHPRTGFLTHLNHHRLGFLCAKTLDRRPHAAQPDLLAFMIDLSVRRDRKND